ncbi:hypothetical protein [Nannocystis pusilla]|uniref:hypothetical protein n=1 Tax=Nannocystis pusilla TaxID=889268 RepID=UPI003B82A12A
MWRRGRQHGRDDVDRRGAEHGRGHRGDEHHDRRGDERVTDRHRRRDEHHGGADVDDHEHDRREQHDREPVVGWRSELYPEDWTPEFTGPDGRFLHDFSYAGYRLAAAAPGSELPALTIDAVRDHGADATGMSDATAALQAALDAAAEAEGRSCGCRRGSTGSTGGSR